jgi:hypothetical protein
LSADTLELAWAPGQDILYQQAGNRNFIALAPQTGRERPLIRDTSVGWIFTPIHAPSGTSIAVAWNRRPVQGVWIVDEEDAHERPLSTSGPPALIGWSRNGGSIYVLEGGRPIYRGVMAARGETLTDARLVTLSAHDGALQSRLDLPFDEVGGVSMTPDGSVVVCAVYVSQSDVWIIDRFDPNPLDR